MAETPEYTKRAIQNYNNKFDRIAVNLPKGSKDRIKELTGESCNAYINKLVLSDLERLEADRKTLVDQEQKEDTFPMNPPEESAADQEENNDLPECFR